MGRNIKFYEGDLVRLFENARPYILEALKQAGPRQLEVSKVNTDYFTTEYKSILEKWIDEKGKKVAVEHIYISYNAGTTRAGQFLRKIGIDGSLGGVEPDMRVIEILEQRNFAALKGITDEMSKKIISELSDGILKGESIPELSKRINESVDGIGIVRAKVMARTESMYAFNKAATERYARHGITKVEWLTAPEGGENGPCPDCESNSGKVFSMDSQPDCPLHPNCRCILLPVVEGD
jgi:SPP1 gp7 family putative phage head morphogenesis protein